MAGKYLSTVTSRTVEAPGTACVAIVTVNFQTYQGHFWRDGTRMAEANEDCARDAFKALVWQGVT
jgi:hypothetical protein